MSAWQDFTQIQADFKFQKLEVIPKTALMAKMKTFVVGTEVEAGIAVTITMQTDDVQTMKEPFTAQMKFWDGF